MGRGEWRVSQFVGVTPYLLEMPSADTGAPSPSLLPLFLLSFREYFLSTYHKPSTVMDTGDTTVNKQKYNQSKIIKGLAAS